MARPAVTVTFLFILFAVSYARFPSDPTENDVTTTDDAIPLLESDPKTTNTILLPSEKPESEPATVVELESEPEPEIVVDFEAESETETTESKHLEPEISEESTQTATEFVPLTVTSFRPINRHIPRRPLIRFRHRHGCRHSRQFKQGGPRFHHNREVSYGNDMILSSGGAGGEDLSSSSDPVFRGGGRQIPARWVRFHHGGARFPYKHDDVEEKEEMKRPHHYHNRHRHVEGEEHEHEHEHRHDHEHEHEHRHQGGFMRGIRKFLNQF